MFSLKQFKFTCVSILLVLMAGCSSQFAYNNLDWLIHWYIDDFIDLDKPQKAQFDAQFVVWQQWHRTEELKRYQTQLLRVRDLVETNDINEDVFQRETELARMHWERLRSRVAPELVDMAKSLSSKQVAAMFDALEERNEESQEEIIYDSEEERIEQLEKNLNKRVKEYIGKLTKAQKQIISDFAPRFTVNRPEWVKYRRAVQAEAKQLFLLEDRGVAFEQALTALLDNPDVYKHDLLVANSEINRKIYAEMVMVIKDTLTRKQKTRLLRKIDDLIEDLGDLQEGS